MQTCNVAKRGVAHTPQIAFKKQQNVRLVTAMQVSKLQSPITACQIRCFSRQHSLQAAATELTFPVAELVIPKYCEAIHQTRRRPTRTVTVSAQWQHYVGRILFNSANFTLPLQIGPVKVGSEHPIALQTMTTTDTRNVQATVDQVGVSDTPPFRTACWHMHHCTIFSL
jgi:hypothetical protein